jgi:hypothetical protein
MSTGELAALASIDVDIDPTLTGFSTGEIDVILSSACDPDDEIIPQVPATSKTRPGDIWILGEHRVRCPEGPRHLGLKPVSADIRTSLCSRAEIPPGKSLARPETGAAFFVTPSDSGRQRPRHAASPTAKPRKIKDYSDDARKPELRRTAWWSWEDSNQQPNDYGRG